jgi:hypothetical protein
MDDEEKSKRKKVVQDVITRKQKEIQSSMPCHLGFYGGSCKDWSLLSVFEGHDNCLNNRQK